MKQHLLICSALLALLPSCGGAGKAAPTAPAPATPTPIAASPAPASASAVRKSTSPTQAAKPAKTGAKAAKAGAKPAAKPQPERKETIRIQETVKQVETIVS